MDAVEAKGPAPKYEVSRLTEGQTVSVPGAADYLRVTRRTIYNWLKAGRLPIAGRTPGGSVRIYRDDLLKVK